VNVKRKDLNLLVSAPGKMMIAGEYAVLHGAEALVAAVDRRAYARFDPGAATTLSREAAAAFVEARKSTGANVAGPTGVAEGFTVDTASMQMSGTKLGLGSSAAAAAAAAGLAFAEQGIDIASAEGRARTLDAALRGHRAISPRGSGADVAASVLGGFVRFRKLGDTVETHPVEWPSELIARVVWTGKAARTSDYIAKVDALAERDPAQHRAVMANLGSEADRFVAAVLAAESADVIESTAAYGEAMAALGRAVGADIVDETLARVATLAAQVGGAAKPSGAGGGDVALVLLPDSEAEAKFVRLCSEERFSVLSIDWGAPGVRVEPHSVHSADDPSRTKRSDEDDV
jgi:phosphomevalonate kinase